MFNRLIKLYATSGPRRRENHPFCCGGGGGSNPPYSPSLEDDYTANNRDSIVCQRELIELNCKFSLNDSFKLPGVVCLGILAESLGTSD